LKLLPTENDPLTNLAAWPSARIACHLGQSSGRSHRALRVVLVVPNRAAQSRNPHGGTHKSRTPV
jgi:hypothetical protein